MADKNKKEEEDEIIPVGEDLEDEGHVETDEDKAPKKKVEEEDLDDDDDDDDDADEDGKRLGARDEEDEQKEIRRKEKKSRRQRQKEARERKDIEIRFLAKRNEELERRFSELDQRVGASEASQIDGRISHLKQSIKKADQIMAAALEKQDGERFTEAQEIRDDLRDNLKKLEEFKGAQDKRQPNGQAGAQPFVQHAARWMSEHEWWEPDGDDKDSRKVSQIDSALVQEGYDPNNPGYWNELSRRVKKALPHRYGEADDDDEDEDAGGKKKAKKKRSSGPQFRTGGRERPLKANEVYISPERKAAMIEAGVWDDPKLRQKYLKQYQNYDKQHASNA